MLLRQLRIAFRHFDVEWPKIFASTQAQTQKNFSALSNSPPPIRLIGERAKKHALIRNLRRYEDASAGHYQSEQGIRSGSHAERGAAQRDG
jgi:hypothetical protein